MYVMASKFVSRLLRRCLIAVVWVGLGLTSASAQEVIVGVGNFEPYFNAKQQRGIFTDIISAAFKQMPNSQAKFITDLSHKGLIANYKAGRIDAVANLPDSVSLDICRSDPAFRYRNVAITRKRSKITLDSVSDLHGLSVVTFEGANPFFGDEFARVTSAAAYTEVEQPARQAKMLFKGRANVSVGDMFIFLQALQESEDPQVTPDHFSFYDIFPQAPTRFGFRDPQTCAEFNQALKKIRASGEYEAIYQAYLQDLNYRP